MRKVTSDFKNQIERDNRNYYEWVDITLKDGTVLNLTNKNIWNSGIKIEDAVSDTSEFQIGTAIINKATVTLNNLYDDFTDYDFDEAKIVIYIGYNIVMSTTEESWRDINGEQILDINGNEIILQYNGTFLEKVKMFTGTVVESPYQNSSLITLTCEDNMLLFDRDYSESKLPYPATRAQILRDACEVCGVSLETLTFDNSDYIVNTKPSSDQLTFRQVMAWTAQLDGQFLRCNSDGKLCCKWYDLANYEADTVNEEHFDIISANNSVTVNSEDVIITGIQVTAYQEDQSEEETPDTSLYGKTGYVITIADNKLIEKGTASTVAAMIGKRVAGMRFRPFSASTLNNPTYEAGDICIVKDRKGVSYKSFLTSSTFQVGQYHTVQCGAKSAAKNSSKQYSVFSQAQAENRKNFQREKTERERVAEEFNTALNSASGMYPTEVKQEDGSTILYVHDKRTLEDSKNVFKITSYGVGFSTDGGKTYQFGFTIDGDFLTRILYAVGINADYINTGALTVKDKDGNIIFQADMVNNRVIISGDYVQIGGKTVPDKLSEILEESKTYSDGKLSEYSKEATKELENLREYVKEKSGTWRQETDPALSWTKTASIPWMDVDGNSILDVNGNEIFLVFEEEKVNHEGDLWKNTKTNREYRYENGGWVEMPVPDFVFDEIDGKSSVFYTQPTPPYNERDVYFTGTDILICMKSRIDGNYDASDWSKKDNYTDDSALENFMTGEYAEAIKEIGSQIDGKSETWRQDNDPSAEWTTDELKVQHKNDLWYHISEQKTYIYTGTGWEDMKTNPPDDVFDAIDGKAQIFSSQPNPPYYVNDLYFNGKSILVCKQTRETGNYTASDWAKKEGYTDDTKANEVAESLKAVEKDLKNQIDGKIDTFSQANDPSTEWDTAEKKTAHTGDIWYDESEKATKRWSGTAWTVLQDKEAEDAKKLAETKKRIFVTTPVPPYDVGDLWSQGSDGDLMSCKIAKASGEKYAEVDWEKATKYTDDSAVKELNEILDFAEIFKRLTNDGEVKGLYKVNDQLYFSFSYAKGGTLALGGENNGNGLLEIYDSNGELIGTLGKDGADIKGIFRTKGNGSEITISNGIIDMRYSDDIFTQISTDKSGYGSSFYVVGTQDKTWHSFGVNGASMMRLGQAGSGDFSNTPMCYISAGFYSVGKSYARELHLSTSGNGYFTGTASVIVSHTSFNAQGTLSCSGTKNRIIDTESYGNRLLTCYETPVPMFGDVGEGKTDDDGKCYIDLDQIFVETISKKCKYQVFLQKYGKGDVWVSERKENYFVVEGTPNLEFAWEIKARQTGCDLDRLETWSEKESDLDYGALGAEEYANYLYRREGEEMI